MLVLAQGRAWQGIIGGEPMLGTAPNLPQPSLGNPGTDSGPLGEEDRKNFHP
jgi:hypothetical protein